ncbi:MAG: 4-hydroxy-tetrahydrodipicolinate synthase [Sporomusaceae bacterium]|nr:4-hydroxy-tetrahydrodipicolinate synthase [Sporomusaceae bacterium]
MFRGIITPVITPLKENRELDFAGMEAVIEHLIGGGMNGLLFLGSLGEFFALTSAEKKELIRFVVAKVNNRIPVLIGTGGTVVSEVIELTQFAKEAGADGAVLISPYYFSLNEATIAAYYEEIAKNTSLPLLIYNFPDRTSVNLSPQLIANLAKNYPQIVGMKDTVDNISHTRELIQTVKTVAPDFSILSGFDEYLLPNLMAGGDGVICGLTNIVPELFSALLINYQQGNFAAIGHGQEKINILMNLYKVSQPFISGIKAATALRGVPVTSLCKAPSLPLTTEQETEVKLLLNKAQIL